MKFNVKVYLSTQSMFIIIIIIIITGLDLKKLFSKRMLMPSSRIHYTQPALSAVHLQITTEQRNSSVRICLWLNIRSS